MMWKNRGWYVNFSAWALPVTLLSSVHKQLVSPGQSWVVCLSTLPPLQARQCPQCSSEETTQPLLFSKNAGKHTHTHTHTHTIHTCSPTCKRWYHTHAFLHQMSLISEVWACNSSVAAQLRNKRSMWIYTVCVCVCVCSSMLVYASVCVEKEKTLHKSEPVTRVPSSRVTWRVSWPVSVYAQRSGKGTAAERERANVRERGVWGGGLNGGVANSKRGLVDEGGSSEEE